MYSQGWKPLLCGIMGCFSISSNSVIFNLGDLLKNTVLSPEILTQLVRDGAQASAYYFKDPSQGILKCHQDEELGAGNLL